MKLMIRNIFGMAGLCAVLFSLGTALPLHAGDMIYRFVDDNGVIHFTNVPVSPNFKPYTKEYSLKPVKTISPHTYDKLLKSASRRHKISFPLLKAMVKVESDFNHRAVSKAGAVGLMQIMPQNFKALKIDDPYNPWENVMGGARYMKQLLRRYDGKVSLALAAYNAGPSAVEEYKRSIPPYPETQNFIKKVIRYYIAYKEELKRGSV